VPEHDHDRRSLLQSRAARCRNANGGSAVARKARARNLGCKAQIDSAGLGLETNGAAVESEERLLPGKQSGENRLKSVRGADFAGASISSQVWEWRHRWNIHYESAGTNLHHCIRVSLLHLCIFHLSDVSIGSFLFFF
jgi:hypothetical protein